MKYFLFFLLFTIPVFATAQKIESIHVDLYTDSLKKGTYNYINIDGKLSDGKYLPLDSSDLIFTASEGKFSGNNLWIDRDFKNDKVTIRAVLRNDHSLYKEFTMYIKKKPNDENVKTMDELMGEIDKSKTPRKKRS